MPEAPNPFEASDEEYRRISEVRPPFGVAKVTRFLFAVGFAIAVLALASELITYRLLSAIDRGEEVTVQDADQDDLRQMALGIIGLVTFVPTMIAMFVWFYRSNNYLRSLGIHDMTFSPGWAVGWFFVPFLNMFRPYQVAQELHKASSATRPDDRSWQMLSSSKLVAAWWTCNIASVVATRASMRVAMKAETIEELMHSSVVSVISNAVDIPLMLTSYMMVGMITSQIRQLASSPAFAQRSVSADPDEPVDTDVNDILQV